MLKFVSSIVFFVFATNIQATLKIDEVREMKTRSLAVFLVPESPQMVQKGTGNSKDEANSSVVSVVKSLNDALNIIPSMWTFSPKVEIFEAGAINRIPDGEKNKWTVLTIGTNRISDFNSNLSNSVSTFTLTLTLADGKYVDLYSNHVDLSIPFPLSVNENGTITTNEMALLLKLVQFYLTDCDSAGKVVSMEDFGNKRAEANCSTLVKSKIILPEILRHSKVKAEKYEEIPQMIFVANQEFDQKINKPLNDEYFVISMPADVSSAQTGGTVGIGVSVLVSLQLIVDAKTGDVVGCFRGNGLQTHPAWIKKSLKC